MENSKDKIDTFYEILNDVKNLETKNLAAEILRKLIEGEIKARSRQNLVQGQKFSEKLE